MINKKNKLEIQILKRLKKELIDNNYWSKKEKYIIKSEKIPILKSAKRSKINEN
jgi:hypothetical protein